MSQQLQPGDGTGFRVFLESEKHGFARKSIRKNEFLVEEGKVCEVFCYLESGILQHCIQIDGVEKTTYLALRNSVTSSLKSFLTGQPSRKSIKAIADCEVWYIERSGFEKLLSGNETFRKLYYDIIERQICLIDDYRIDLLTLTPEERYEKLLVTEPKLLLEIPLHYLSSFLGISDRHMSRIRKHVK